MRFCNNHVFYLSLHAAPSSHLHDIELWTIQWIKGWGGGEKEVTDCQEQHIKKQREIHIVYWEMTAKARGVVYKEWKVSFSNTVSLKRKCTEKRREEVNKG